MEQGGVLESLVFLAQALALSLSGYAGKYYYDATGDPLTHGWAFPRLMASLAVANAILLLWLVLVVRHMRRDVQVIEIQPDGTLRHLKARVRGAK